MQWQDIKKPETSQQVAVMSQGFVGFLERRMNYYIVVISEMITKSPEPPLMVFCSLTANTLTVF